MTVSQQKKIAAIALGLICFSALLIGASVSIHWQNIFSSQITHGLIFLAAVTTFVVLSRIKN